MNAPPDTTTPPKLAARLLFAVSILIHITWFTHYSVDRWETLQTGLDYAHIDSAAWQTAQGHFMFSHAKMINFWSEHVTPILLVVSAFYLLSDAYWFIFFFQAATAGLAAVPLFMAARRILREEWLALAIALAYLANFKMHEGLLADYHEWAHTPLFFFAAFYALLARRWGWFSVWAALLLSCKEDQFVNLAALGIYAALGMRNLRAAGAIWAASALFAAVLFGIVYPELRYWSGYKYASYYSWIWSGGDGVMASVMEAMNILAGSELRLRAWGEMLLQYGFLPLLSPVGLLMLAGPSLELFLSSYGKAYGLSFHYPMAVVPVWTIASLLGLSNLASLARRLGMGVRAAFFLTALGAAYLLAVNTGVAVAQRTMPLLTAPGWHITDDQRRHAAIVREELAAIPYNAVVSAHDAPFNALLHRPDSYLYRGDREGHAIVDFYEGRPAPKGYDMWPFGAMTVEYVVFDVSVADPVKRALHWRDVRDLLAHPSYRLHKKRGGLFIFRSVERGEKVK